MQSLLEIVMALQGFPLKKAETILTRIKSNNDMAEERNEQLKWEIVRHHFDNNAVFRTKTGKIPGKWEQLPVMNKQDFQYPLNDLLSRPFQRKDVYIGNTSGSSGHPFFYAKDKLCHALTWVQIKNLYAQHGISLSSRQARFYGIPLGGKARKIEQWKDRIANRRRFPVFDLSEQVMRKWLTVFRKERFVYLYGYTSSLVYFARFCKDEGQFLKKICPSLRLCIVTSEVCTPQDRKVLEEGFGLKVVNEYGASETGLIAFEDPIGNWQICPELLHVEVADEQGQPVEPGKPGNLLITSLFNKAMPVIRYQIGDVGVLEKDETGRKVLKSLVGRTNDFVRLPSGKTSPGLTMYYVSRSLMEETGFIREFIIRQIKPDTLVFEIDSKQPVTEVEKNLIQAKMDEYLEPGLKLVVRQVDKINRPESGKIKHFYSEI